MAIGVRSGVTLGAGLREPIAGGAGRVARGGRRLVPLGRAPGGRPPGARPVPAAPAARPRGLTLVVPGSHDSRAPLGTGRPELAGGRALQALGDGWAEGVALGPGP